MLQPQNRRESFYLAVTGMSQGSLGWAVGSCEGWRVLTGRDVWGSVAVTQVGVAGLGHLQVDHIIRVLQGCHGVLVHDILQPHAVDLGPRTESSDRAGNTPEIAAQ